MASITATMKRCHNCWTVVPKQDLVGGLFCSQKCSDEQEDIHGQLADQLRAAGFYHDAEAANVWNKDGVSVTAEEVKLNGLEATLAKHRQLVQTEAATQAEVSA